MNYIAKVDGEILHVPESVLFSAFYSHVPQSGEPNYSGLKGVLKAEGVPYNGPMEFGHLDIDEMVERELRDLTAASVGNYDLLFRIDRRSRTSHADLDALENAWKNVTV